MDDFRGAVERGLAPEHAESLVALSTEAGWNQVAADWRFMLRLGSGIGMADEAGRWIASALALPMAPRLWWLSMVLTTKAWRGRGIGTHLLRRCIETVRARGATPGLDATELGRPVYLPIGFADVYALRRWHIERAPEAAAPPAGIRIRRAAAADMAAVAAYDAPRSAMRRGDILAHLQGRAPYLAFVAERGDALAGFVLGREGRIAHSLGPIVAESEAIALALAAQAGLAARPPFVADVPVRHDGMRRWLEASGAVSPRGFTRMVLGAAPGLAANERVFAISGPELA
ncbi:MAG: GNAT family N-acetyltransferase [Candidatus Odyssella sp.]|nr:GNAT family N-acetyltransferase [Candidatus Odyssella sp.]